MFGIIVLCLIVFWLVYLTRRDEERAKFVERRPRKKSPQTRKVSLQDDIDDACEMQHVLEQYDAEIYDDDYY